MTGDRPGKPTGDRSCELGHTIAVDLSVEFAGDHDHRCPDVRRHLRDHLLGGHRDPKHETERDRVERADARSNTSSTRGLG